MCDANIFYNLRIGGGFGSGFGVGDGYTDYKLSGSDKNNGVGKPPSGGGGGCGKYILYFLIIVIIYTILKNLN